MSNRAKRGSAFDVGFDLGTSPHGLSAELHQTVQETPEALSCHPPASQQAERAEKVPQVFRSSQVLEACRKIKAAAGEHHFPIVLTTSQMEHVQRAISLALDDAIEALEGEPAKYHHEIQPDIDAYNQIYAVLKLARSGRKGHGKVNEDWRGIDL